MILEHTNFFDGMDYPSSSTQLLGKQLMDICDGKGGLVYFLQE